MNDYYYRNREERKIYQRKYRLRCKEINLSGMKKVVRKYKKKPKPTTKIIVRKTTIFFD
jgi:hypothetical protein